MLRWRGEKSRNDWFKTRFAACSGICRIWLIMEITRERGPGKKNLAITLFESG